MEDFQHDDGQPQSKSKPLVLPKGEFAHLTFAALISKLKAHQRRLDRDKAEQTARNLQYKREAAKRAHETEKSAFAVTPIDDYGVYEARPAGFTLHHPENSRFITGNVEKPHFRPAPTSTRKIVSIRPGADVDPEHTWLGPNNRLYVLETTYDAVKKEKEQLELEIESYESRLQQLAANLQRAEAKSESHHANLVAWKKQAETMEQNLQEAKQTNSLLTEQLDMLKSSKSTLELTNTQLASEKDRLEGDNIRLQQELEQSQEQLLSLTDSVRSLTGTKDEKEAAVKALESLSTEAATKTKQLETDNATLKQQLDDLISKLAKQEDKATDLSNQLQTLKDANVQLDGKNWELEGEVTMLKDRNKELQDKIAQSQKAAAKSPLTEEESVKSLLPPSVNGDSDSESKGPDNSTEVVHDDDFWKLDTWFKRIYRLNQYAKDSEGWDLATCKTDITQALRFFKELPFFTKHNESVAAIMLRDIMVQGAAQGRHFHVSKPVEGIAQLAIANFVQDKSKRYTSAVHRVETSAATDAAGIADFLQTGKSWYFDDKEHQFVPILKMNLYQHNNEDPVPPTAKISYRVEVKEDELSLTRNVFYELASPIMQSGDTDSLLGDVPAENIKQALHSSDAAESDPDRIASSGSPFSNSDLDELLDDAQNDFPSLRKKLQDQKEGTSGAIQPSQTKKPNKQSQRVVGRKPKKSKQTKTSKTSKNDDFVITKSSSFL